MPVKVDMKLGGTLDHKTLEQIHRMAFQRVREGEKPVVTGGADRQSRDIYLRAVETAYRDMWRK